MSRLALLAATAVLIIHGLIHLMGFVAYWPLAELAELPYKTTLLGGRWVVGAAGMRVYGVVWLLTAVGFVAAAVGLLTGQAWQLPLLGAAVILSLLVTSLDWSHAFRGTLISLVILVPVLLAWGLRVQPQPFPAYPEATPALTAVALPDDLPDPVARYYETVMGENVPVVETAVVSGRGRLRVNGITFPARFRFTYDAGEGYRHYIKATFFGYPLMTVNEWYLDGRARLELPFGVVENEPKVDMAANLGLWGESIWLPSVFITDARVRWEGVDATTARLMVPFEDTEDVFTVSFDSETGRISAMEAMRYRDAADATKTLWHNETLGWQTFHGVEIPAHAATTWMDEATPWAIWTVEDVVYNVDVADAIRAAGR